MRRVAPYDAPAPTPRGALERAWSFDVRALTPIFKGSARPDGIEERHPFRVASLRGQLRAWWRAVHDTTDPGILAAEERRLFGGVLGGGDDKRPRASRVWMGLADVHSRLVATTALKKETGGRYEYALWVNRKGTIRELHVEARAQLTVALRPLPADDLEAEAARLEAALRAMLLLGGAGSRTRRGLGCLWSDKLLRPSLEEPEDLVAHLEGIAPPHASRGWPSLAGIAVAWSGATFPQAGAAVDRALADFKQLRGMRPVEGGGYCGDERLVEAQSDWAAIRDQSVPAHAFTAALGMPLTYRSTNGHLHSPVELTPVGRDRLPSPIHVRAVPTGGGYAPVILALRPWFDGNIEANGRTGGLREDAVDVLLRGLKDRGWRVRRTGGGK